MGNVPWQRAMVTVFKSIDFWQEIRSKCLVVSQICSLFIKLKNIQKMSNIS